ncbi:MAG TPA: hypothetical protein V6C65_08650 [Allocoleopsis sp.]
MPPSPDSLTFEQAIELTHSLLDQLEQNTLSEAEVEAAIVNLVSSENGARGFFVNYLPDPRSFADDPSDAVVQALRTSPAIVADLMAKNLAMSTAMAIHHRRQQNEELVQGSDRVRSRSLQLIQRLQLPEMQDKLQQLQESLTTGIGSYQAFLDRWGYDAEQRGAIAAAVQQVLEH